MRIHLYILLGLLLLISIASAQSSSDIQFYLSKIHCNEETDEVGSDEPYVLVTTVNLASSVSVSGFSVPIPAYEVFKYGPFDDVDKGETHYAEGFFMGHHLVSPFWGVTGDPAPLDDPDKVIFIVALMENDNGDTDALRGIVKGVVASSVYGSISLSRQNKVAALIKDINSELRMPTGFPNFDDKVGDPQELQFSREELNQIECGQIVSKDLVFNGDGGSYTLTFIGTIPNLEPVSPHTAPDKMASDSAAGLYADINVILSEQGIDLGSPAANSLDRNVHYNWAKVQNIQTLEDETARKIAIIATNKDKFLDMYRDTSIELARTGVFTGGGASMDPNAHYNWARDNVNYAQSTTGVRNVLLDKVYTGYELI